MTNTSSSSLRSFHIYRKLNGRRECKVLYEEKGTVCIVFYSMDSILRELSSALLPFISYNTVKDVPF